MQRPGVQQFQFNTNNVTFIQEHLLKTVNVAFLSSRKLSKDTLVPFLVLKILLQTAVIPQG